MKPGDLVTLGREAPVTIWKGQELYTTPAVGWFNQHDLAMVLATVGQEYLDSPRGSARPVSLVINSRGELGWVSTTYLIEAEAQ